MGEFIKQISEETRVEVDEMFAKSDKVIHGLFNAMINRIRIDFQMENSNGTEI